MDNIKEHTMGSCYIRIFNIFCSQLKRNLCIDSHTNCINKVLYRKYQRQSCHRLLTDLCHKKAVYDVVQWIHQHRQYHRHCHRCQKRQNRFFLHKSIVHSFFLSLFHCNKKRHTIISTLLYDNRAAKRVHVCHKTEKSTPVLVW